MAGIATVSLAVFGILTWLLGITFFLGKFVEKQTRAKEDIDKIEKNNKEDLVQIERRIDAKFTAVFQKLDEISKSVPHQCQQIEKIADLDAKQRSG